MSPDGTCYFNSYESKSMKVYESMKALIQLEHTG